MGISTAPTTNQPSVNHDYSSPADDPRCESDSESEGELAHLKVSTLTADGKIIETEQVRAARRAEDLRNAKARDDASFLGNAAFIVGFGVTLGVVSFALEQAYKYYCDNIGNR